MATLSARGIKMLRIKTRIPGHMCMVLLREISGQPFRSSKTVSCVKTEIAEMKCLKRYKSPPVGYLAHLKLP